MMTRRLVTSGEFGSEWPLSVDQGTITCETGAWVFTTPDGRRFAMNGVAIERGLTEIDEIALTGKTDDTVKNLFPLRQLAKELCL